MKYKSIAIGAFIGICIGVVLYFIFPNLLPAEFTYNAAQRKALGYPENFYSATSGSIYQAGILFPLLMGILGAVLGAIYSKKNKFLQ